ncbi:GAF domain-containing protein [Pseudonocardia xishanensis]
MGLTAEIGRTAVAGADLGPLLQRICSTLPGTLGVPAAAIVLVDLPDTQLAGVTASGPDPGWLGEMELRAGTGPVQGAVRSGRAMVTPDLTRIGPPELAAAAADTGLTCSVVVPLRVNGEPVGGLQLFGHPGRPVGDGHVDALAGLADVLSARLSDVCALRRLTGTVARLTAEHEASMPVAYAVGMLAERYRTDPEEAARFLDSMARNTGTPITEAARTVLERTDVQEAPTTALRRVTPGIPTPRGAQEEAPHGRVPGPRPGAAPSAGRRSAPDPRHPAELRGVSARPAPADPRPDLRGPLDPRTPVDPRTAADPRGAARPDFDPAPAGDRLDRAPQPQPHDLHGQPLACRRRRPEPDPQSPPPPSEGRARHRRADIG